MGILLTQDPSGDKEEKLKKNDYIWKREFKTEKRKKKIKKEIRSTTKRFDSGVGV